MKKQLKESVGGMLEACVVAACVSMQVFPTGVRVVTSRSTNILVCACRHCITRTQRTGGSAGFDPARKRNRPTFTQRLLNLNV